MWQQAAKKKPFSNFTHADTLGFMQHNAKSPRRCDCAAFGGGERGTFQKVISKYILKWDGY